MKKIALLGATGSIGTSTLDIIRSAPGNYSLTSVSSGNSWEKLAAVAREFTPDIAAIYNEEHYAALKEALSSLPCRVLAGAEGVVEAAAQSGAEMLVSAAVGAAGLRPTIAAIEAGLDIALANKETLVMAGALVMRMVKEKGVKLLPVDSEHSAVFQCLQSGRPGEVKKIVLTASGGPFRGKTFAELGRMAAAEALAHPTWEMGPKITVDSATLVNKALEVIEAHWLFDMPYDNIEVVVHPQSVVHSMVEFVDGSCIAQLGPTDMRIPIQYALTYPERTPGRVAGMDLAAIESLTFERPDTDTFACLRLGYDCGREGGLAPAVYSAANEAAVDLFLNGRIGFNDIARLIAEAVEIHTRNASPTLDDIIAADSEARKIVYGCATDSVG